MTWVFGSPALLGSAVCVADIQVTVGDRSFDCLRKVYGLDQNVVAGFAGNVRTGFTMLARLAQLIESERSGRPAPVDVRTIIERFPGEAKALFAQLDDAGRSGGSAVLLAGASAVPNRVYGSEPHVVRFLCPNFEAQEVALQTWGSIGSGSEVALYRAELEQVTGDEALPLLSVDVGRPGGFAHTMAIAVMMSVADLPTVRGISKHFHVAVVFANGWEMRTSDREIFPPDGPPQQIRMPRVAHSWAELEAILSPHLGQSLTTAIA